MDQWRNIGVRMLLAAAAVSGAVSCSVKEDRTECPVYVSVLTDRFVEQGLSDGGISFAAARPVSQETVSFLSYVERGYEQACPRGRQDWSGPMPNPFPPGRTSMSSRRSPTNSIA